MPHSLFSLWIISTVSAPCLLQVRLDKLNRLRCIDGVALIFVCFDLNRKDIERHWR